MSKNKIHAAIFAAGILLFILAYILSHRDKASSATPAPPDSEQILGMLQSQTQLVSTVVTLRKMAIFDSETGFVSLNPNTWRLGRRFCIVPVDITLKYGIDLSDMSADDITRIDTSNVVLIRLPKARILDSSFAPRTSRSELVTFTTGLRDNIGETTIQAIKTQTYNEVLEKDEQIHQQVANEIYINTKSVFRTLLQSVGLKAEFTNEPVAR